MPLSRALAASTLLALLIAALAMVAPGADRPTPPPFVFAPEPGGGDAAARIHSLGPDGPRFGRALAQAGEIPSSPLTLLHPWKDRGPAVPGGRITDLALTPDSQTLYVASASGGVWRSDDGGVTVEPAWPLDAPPAIGAIAVLEDGTVLAGTGEANAGGGSTTFPGTGVFRSTDGGATWEPSGLAESGTIARLVIDPDDPDVVLAAAGGSLFTPGGQRGVYRSTDRGRTWDLVLAGANDTTGGADLTVHPATPDIVLASTWDRQRLPDRRRYGGPGSGLHRSTDGGLTWTPVDAGIPGFTEDAGRIAVALSPADPAVAYAVVTRGDGRADGLYRSDDAGLTWGLVNDGPDYTASQFIFGWWFSKVFPAPDDPQRVLIPGLILQHSDDGGRTLQSDVTVHADQHALVWDPEDPQRAWIATDGGLYRSDEGARARTWTLADTQGFTQPYAASAHPAATEAVSAGFQDLGCMIDGGDGRWIDRGQCGDGLVASPHPERGDEVIICGQYGRCRLHSEEGTEALPTPPVDRAGWGAPLVRAPGAPDTLLFGGNTLHRSDDGGRTWTRISPDLTRGVSPDPDYPYGTISEILVRDPEAQDVLVGTDDGLLWRTQDGGTSWETLRSGSRWVTGIAAAPDGRHLLVGTSGYFAGDDTAQVHRSDDGGRTWDSVQEGLPDAPVNDVLAAGDAVLVATDVGLFTAFDAYEPGSPTWRRVGVDLPQSPVLDVDHIPTEGLVTAALFGRGVWQMTLPQVSRAAGPDRYATAVAVAGTVPVGEEGVTTVVLASGEDFPDALTAASLVARTAGWRLLLTPQDRLAEPAAATLAEWAPQQVIVAGGPAAVDEAVLDEVRAVVDSAVVRRVAGPSRYATATEFAAEREGGRAAILVTAGRPFDALAASSLARLEAAPILLVDPDRLPEETADALAAHAPGELIVVGGAAAVSDAVAERAAQAAGGALVRRIAGVDRIDTAAMVGAALVEAGTSTPEVWLAAADAVSDALVAAATGSAILLTGSDALPPATADALPALGPRQVRLAGGPAVIGDELIEALRTGGG